MVKVMHYVTFGLLFVAWGDAYLFFNNINLKSYIFVSFKCPFTPKVKLISLIWKIEFESNALLTSYLNK